MEQPKIGSPVTLARKGPGGIGQTWSGKYAGVKSGRFAVDCTDGVRRTTVSLLNILWT